MIDKCVESRERKREKFIDKSRSNSRLVRDREREKFIDNQIDD